MSLSLSVSLKIDEFMLKTTLDLGNKILAITGPNGCGKSTLLKILTGAYQPDEGFIKWNDTFWFNASTHAFVKPEHRNIGYLPQNLSLFPHLTALDNVAFGLNSSVSRKKKRAQALAFLEEISGAHLASKYPRELSGGEAQRIAIARSLILNPCLWLLDEPFSAIDPNSKEDLRSFVFQKILNSNTPAIVVTHSTDNIKELNATVAVMKSGAIANISPFEEYSIDQHPSLP